MNRQIYFTLSLLTIQIQQSGKITLVLGNKSMKCVFCKHGTTYTGTVNVTLERDNCIIVLKDVPADICENCGEYYLSQITTAAVFARAERSIHRNAEVEILRFAA
jgi:YgiT-type zinc finger domain-containing protein